MFVFVHVTYLFHIHEHGAMRDVGKDGPQRLQICCDPTLQLLIKGKLCVHDFTDSLTKVEETSDTMRHHTIPAEIVRLDKTLGNIGSHLHDVITPTTELIPSYCGVKLLNEAADVQATQAVVTHSIYPSASEFSLVFKILSN